ncbi:alternate-type signal peptide domain-containing protein [Rhodococcus xishaensis]|uniref:Alternate-type signal peptide domain-containing protein n=1 Tax=Rhodococcus xishaensis TaxID=2487364 RepID=A0A3S3CU20_9NOCA|nr:alternate-type signal peptide domain-containing protein [Rhodococcus xishaensis]RVW05622.1 alternate-type signal peptide domain-containing protein [Rhodococcus xishaensis]
MNKQTKGAIAAGAAALLLAGGAGTWAAWSASETVGGDGVQSGSLSLTQEGEAGWAVGGEPIDITTFKAVPGDVLTYSASFLVGAEGNNLSATLTADLGSIGGGNELADRLGIDTTATIDGVALDPSGEGLEITDEHNDKVVDVEVAITFDPDTSGTEAQGQQADLSEFSVTLQQTIS